MLAEEMAVGGVCGVVALGGITEAVLMSGAVSVTLKVVVVRMEIMGKVVWMVGV